MAVDLYYRTKKLWGAQNSSSGLTFPDASACLDARLGVEMPPYSHAHFAEDTDSDLQKGGSREQNMTPGPVFHDERPL